MALDNVTSNRLPAPMALSGQLDLGSTGQIVFPATQNASSNANTLDDYEEGTWTPTVTSSAGTFTSVSATGNYIKIGSLVVATFTVTTTTVGTATGDTLVTVPFTPTQNSMGSCRENNLTGNGGTVNATNGNSNFSYRSYNNNTLNANGTVVIGTVMYRAA